MYHNNISLNLKQDRQFVDRISYCFSPLSYLEEQ